MELCKAFDMTPHNLHIAKLATRPTVFLHLAWPSYTVSLDTGPSGSGRKMLSLRVYPKTQF